MNEALFPSISDAPYLKDKEWLIRYAQAVVAQQSLMPFGYFSGTGMRLNEIRDYARGRQDTSIYRKLLKVEEDSSESSDWFALDYTPLPIAAKFRRQALGLLRDYDYTVEARVVDSLSTKETDKYLEKVKSAVRVKEIAKKVAPQLAEDEALNIDENQPSTIDEFEVFERYSYKHRLSYEIETAVSHVFQTNKIQDLRARWKTDLFDWGVAIAKDYVEDGEVRIRHVDPRRFIISYCDHNTFSDAIYAGEITTVPISKLRDMAGNEFTEDEYKAIAEATNPEKFRDLHNRRSPVGYFYDDLKVDVLDVELITTDYITYKESTNKRGNKVIAKSGYKEAMNPKQGAKYSTKTRSRLYKIKWIIGTKFAFDAGLCAHQKRRTGDPYKVSLSYHVVAYDMDNMRIIGIAETLRPIIDSLQLNWLKIQQALISARPKGFAINAGALEDVPIANGGMDMQPEDLIRFFVKHGVLVYRQENIAGVPANGIPITEMMNGVDPSIQIYWNNVMNAISLIRDSIGLNQVTDGGINPKMLTTPTQMAGAATNNALSGIIESDEKLLLSLAEGAIMRVQSMLMAGDVYTLALGEETARIIKLSKDLSIRDFGISLYKRPTEDEKKILVEEAKALFGAELVDMSDILFIKNITNLKAAEAILNLRIEKKKRERMEQSMMLQQQNAQVQMQSNMASEQGKQQTLQLEYQLKAQLMQQEYELKMQLESLKLQSKEGVADKDRFVSALGVGSQMQIAETQAQQAQAQQSQQPMETPM
jgi:hypothetical protein